jgi:hypothetical protein
MPQNQTDQAADQPTGGAVIDELRLVIQDVRTRLDPMLADMATMQTTFRLAQLYLDRPAPDGTADLGDVDGAVAALNEHADTLSAAAEHTVNSVRERGDRIDATLAEIRRIRAETGPA